MLRLLDTDYINVGMIRYCDSLSDWEDIAANGVLDYTRELKAAGRILSSFCCLYSVVSAL